MKIVNSLQSSNARSIRSFIGIFVLFFLSSFQLYSQTAPADTTTITDRGVMAACATASSASPTANVCSGSGTTTLTNSNANSFGTTTYQWQVSIDGGAYADIAGATSNPYTTAAGLMTSAHTYTFKCNVTQTVFSACTIGLSGATATITPIAGPTTANASTDQSICATTATLAGNSPVGGTETAVWTLVSGSGTITTPTSATSGLTALGGGANDFKWTITLTSNGCTSSDDVIITNNIYTASTLLAYTSTNCPASTTSTELSLTPAPSSGIQWQQNDNGAGFANIVGATTTPYVATKTAGHTYTYRANVTTSCGTYAFVASSAVTNYSMFDYSGGTPSYATANTAGHCYNNLTAGQKYCFAFIYSDFIEMDWLTNGCSGSCPGYQYTKLFSGGSSTATSSACGGSVSSSISGNCAETTVNCGTSCDPNMYDNACGLVQANGMQFGSGCSSPAMTPGNVYYICFTVPAGCGGMSLCPQLNCEAGNCAATPLPIQLLSFNAIPVGRQVQLQWATATEINNNYFTLERSKDAVNFEEIERVKGAGNSVSMINYNSIDEHPYEGISYYRLRQNDYDAKFTYSQLASVELNPDSPLKLIYVTPDNDKNNLQYQFKYSENKPLLVEVVDVVGKTVFSYKISPEDSGQALNIDASGLSKGIYLLKISDGIYSQMKKFIY